MVNLFAPVKTPVATDIALKIGELIELSDEEKIFHKCP